MLIKTAFSPSELWSPCLAFFLSLLLSYHRLQTTRIQSTKGPTFIIVKKWWGQCRRKLRLGPQRGEDVRPSSSWLPELLGLGKAQNSGATESALLWNTRKLELHAKQGMLHVEQLGAWAA